LANIQLRNVTKSYGSVTVIKGIDLEIRRGEFMVFVGPSAAGSPRSCA
jgi:multiple sugar transport system ATP-binding protein